jgi:hypothetical protein
MRGLGLLTATALAVLSSACAQPTTLYRWGEYESLVYDTYMRPGKADPTTQIAKLNEDIERTKAEGQHVPPGVHAHLGYLYYGQGQLDAAYEQFTIEKTLFPESTVFIDGVLARMKKQ